jgi:hypothetical protein
MVRLSLSNAQPSQPTIITHRALLSPLRSCGHRSRLPAKLLAFLIILLTSLLASWNRRCCDATPSLHSSGRLISTDFSRKTIPPYAILSHTWGDDEFHFEDLVNGTGKSKAGYGKILFCGEQAARDHVQYFWVDTCCIDKWNLRELSNAINYMFRWYKNAAKCYVFLSDVSTPMTDAQLHQSTWEASFRKSRWFTRGWTLQELLAPASIDFFSSERQRLGDKASLEQQICEVTRIPVTALRRDPLDEFSVPERMAWMVGRQTTQEEDMAYSLIGIFGVSMEFRYGEGEKRALKRLQEEMEKGTAYTTLSDKY